MTDPNINDNISAVRFDKNLFSAISPKFHEYLHKPYTMKTNQTEKDNKRIFRDNTKCENPYLAYMVCARHMSKPQGQIRCKNEYEDYRECLHGDKTEARRRTLERASKQVGDSVPFVNGKGTWLY